MIRILIQLIQTTPQSPVTISYAYLNRETPEDIPTKKMVRVENFEIFEKLRNIVLEVAAIPE